MDGVVPKWSSLVFHRYKVSSVFAANQLLALYALSIGVENEVFVYLGGFADILIKELTNNTKNQFGYCGLGVSFSSFSFATSMTIPVNATNLKLGIVVSKLLYDLPIEKILK